jgi:hypothetical protein
MLVVNLFGAPGTGKSTTAAGVFFQLKWRGLKVELVGEYAKDVVWEERFSLLQDQLYVLAKQWRRIHRLRDQVDYAVVDSPIPLSHVYSARQDDITNSEEFRALVDQVYRSFSNVSYLLERTKPYHRYGRAHTEEEAGQLQREIEAMLASWNYDYTSMIADITCPDRIVHDLQERELIPSLSLKA